MNWIKVNRESYQRTECTNPRKKTYVIRVCPRDYIPTEEEGSDINCEVLVIRAPECLTTYDLSQIVLEAQDEYDRSDEVNVFYVGGQKNWLDKATRVGLVNSLTVQKEAGLTNAVLWLNGHSFEVNIDFALAFLQQLELYAIACYNMTQSHIGEINQITDRDKLFEYDITKGYPEPISITLEQPTQAK